MMQLRLSNARDREINGQIHPININGSFSLAMKQKQHMW